MGPVQCLSVVETFLWGESPHNHTSTAIISGKIHPYNWKLRGKSLNKHKNSQIIPGVLSLKSGYTHFNLIPGRLLRRSFGFSDFTDKSLELTRWNLLCRHIQWTHFSTKNIPSQVRSPEQITCLDFPCSLVEVWSRAKARIFFWMVSNIQNLITAKYIKIV